MNYSNRVAYKKTGETRIELEAVAAYAKGKSPFVGVPIVEDGTRRPAVFLRKHLQAAIESGVIAAIYSAETNTLTLNGSPKSRYALKDLIACGSWQPWQVKDELEKWARGKRKSAATKKLPANLRLDAKRRAEVEKLERKLAKIHIHKPTNPACATPRTRWDGSSTWMRDSVETYVSQRAQRKALGKLYGKYLQNLYKPLRSFPWEAFHKDVESAGVRIDSYNSWQRVRTRVAHKGLTLPDYLKSLWTFASLARKPWDCERYDAPQARESYLSDRARYLEARREADFIRAQITNVRAVDEPLVLEQAQAA